MQLTSTYGLTRNGIVDSEWFWSEVWLRAVNNYGPWHNDPEARENVVRAIKEICKEAKTNVFLSDRLVTNRKVAEMIKDMTEME